MYKLKKIVGSNIFKRSLLKSFLQIDLYSDALAVVRPARVWLFGFFCSGIQFYVLLSLYLLLVPFHILIYLFYQIIRG